MKRLLIVHNLRTGQDIVHEFCDSDFAFELVEADAVVDDLPGLLCCFWRYVAEYGEVAAQKVEVF